MITLLLLLTGLSPFNIVCDYPGNQAGKGAVLTDFGCLTAGNTPLNGSGNVQILTAAFDVTGQFLWTDSFHLGQSSEIFAIQAWSEGYLLTGSWSSPSTGVNALAYAISSDCQKLWTYSLELSDLETFTTATEGIDGTIVCAGRTKSYGAGGSDVLMVALDKDGNELWQQTYGTPGEEAVYHISACSDGGYIMACQAMDWGAGLGDYWIIKTDSLGDTLWTGTYGGDQFDYPWRVQQMGDYYYVAGNTLSYGSGSYDWWILKLNSSGDLVWDTVWGTKNTDSCMALAVKDGEIIVGGASEAVLNEFETTIVYFDESGSVSEEFFYNPGMIRSIQTLDNNGLLIGGAGYQGSSALWVMCTDSLGYSPELGISDNLEFPSARLYLSQNPVSSSVNIHVPDNFSEVTFFDITGRLVGTATVSANTAVFDTSQLSEGIYTARLSNGISARMVVIK